MKHVFSVNIPENLFYGKGFNDWSVYTEWARRPITPDRQAGEWPAVFVANLQQKTKSCSENMLH